MCTAIIHFVILQRVASVHPKCFISYCWNNSHDAVAKGTKQFPGSLGWMDPRKLKVWLEEHGIDCWIDTEQVGQGGGLFSDIADGLKHAKMVLVCMSDEVNNFQITDAMTVLLLVIL